MKNRKDTFLVTFFCKKLAYSKRDSCLSVGLGAPLNLGRESIDKAFGEASPFLVVSDSVSSLNSDARRVSYGIELRFGLIIDFS